MSFDPGRAKEIFLAVIEAMPGERAVILDRECGDDAALRKRVEALLAAHETSDSAVTLDAPSVTSPDLRPSIGVGGVIAGRYTLQEKIGEGGMGEVWVARQTSPVKRNVALKLIKTGMDSRGVLQRFEQERQALAMMDHPNIARVLDGGITPTGLPFFVMELVNGLPLNRYCDEAKLTPRQRLELFVPICQAVQHAHQKGIVHRDLKPANILVTIIDGQPAPKVIDFGVAKATSGKITDQTMSTSFGAVVGTLEYMSPEQAGYSGDDIDTRTDIYSLGVILYELLTGLRPIDAARLRKAALAEMIRIVQDEEPSKPSTRLSIDESLPSLAALRQTNPKKLTALLRGELDWVVMKCLEKQRDRRYDTANGLARDIQRYLADEVVEARPPSAGYRLKKFIRRNKGKVLAVSLLALTLVGGIVGTTLGLFEARRQTKFAQGETQKKDIANNELTHRLGVSEMVLATAAFDNRDVQLAAERLKNVPVAQRGWEWRYLKQQVIGGIFTIHGHKSPVTAVAFSPDGTRIVTGTGGQSAPLEVKMWDARTGQFLFELKGLPGKLDGFNIPIANVAFSSDSARLVTSAGDIARVWDAKTGALQRELIDPDGIIKCAAFSPDNAQIVTACDSEAGGGAIRIWDARTGNSLLDWKAHRISILRVAFSPDGTRIVSGCRDQSIKVWEAGTGKMLLDAKGVMGRDSSVAFSPDGSRLVVGRDDGSARIIDTKTGAVVLELKSRPRQLLMFYSTVGVLTAAFSPDGTRIVTGGGFNNGEASVWDARTGAELLELKGHTNVILSAAFSPDGERIMTGSLDGTAKVWDARTGTPRLELEGFDTAILGASFSKDDTQIATGGGTLEQPGWTTVLDARTGASRYSLRGAKSQIMSVAFSPDGTRIATGGGKGDVPENELAGEAIVWDAKTAKPIFELMGLKGNVTSLAFSPDGTQIVTGGGVADQNQHNEVKVWDARTRVLLFDLSEAKPGPGFMVGMHGSAAFSPDGTRIVATAGEGPPKVWEARTGKPLVQLEQKGNIINVAFSKDGRRIVGSTLSTTATVWDAENGKAVLDLKGHTGIVMSAAFSPDGARIVTGSMDRTVRIWDARTGTTLLELRGYTGQVSNVSFSADGARILTAGAGSKGKLGELLVWDVHTRPDNVELVGHTEWIPLAVFSQDGARIATASLDKTVKVWDARTGTCLLDLKEPNGQPRSLAFSTDGTRIVAESYDGTSKQWDTANGKELTGQPIPKTFRGESTSADRRFFAQVNGSRVEVVPLNPDDQEIAYRRRHTEPDTRRHRENYRAARAARDDFAAAFHLNLVPAEQRKELIAQADADALKALSELAQETQSAGKRDEAIPLYAEILNIIKAKHGPDDPATIDALFRLGMAYYSARRFEEAIPQIEDAVRLRKARLGLENPQTLSAIGMLAWAHKECGQLKKAIEVLEEADAKDPTGMLKQHLIDIYPLAGEHAKAIPLLLKQLEQVRREQPDVSAAHAHFLRQIGRAYIALKKWNEAEPHLRECVTIYDKELPDQWSTFDATAMLGAALLGQQKNTDAEPLLLKGYEGMKQRRQMMPRTDLRHIPEAVDRLIELYTATNKPDQVKKWQAERARYTEGGAAK